jgi:hypothetical protein
MVSPLALLSTVIGVTVFSSLPLSLALAVPSLSSSSNVGSAEPQLAGDP